MGRRRLTDEEREASKKRQNEKVLAYYYEHKEEIAERSRQKYQKMKHAYKKFQELEKALDILKN